MVIWSVTPKSRILILYLSSTPDNEVRILEQPPLLNREETDANEVV